MFKGTKLFKNYFSARHAMVLNRIDLRQFLWHYNRLQIDIPSIQTNELRVRKDYSSPNTAVVWTENKQTLTKEGLEVHLGGFNDWIGAVAFELTQFVADRPHGIKFSIESGGSFRLSCMKNGSIDGP